MVYCAGRSDKDPGGFKKTMWYGIMMVRMWKRKTRGLNTQTLKSRIIGLMRRDDEIYIHKGGYGQHGTITLSMREYRKMYTPTFFKEEKSGQDGKRNAAGMVAHNTKAEREK